MRIQRIAAAAPAAAECLVTVTLLETAGGRVIVPELVLIGRNDGGHLVVNPPRDVWERGELSKDELMQWSFLVAATGSAMLEVLPQLDGGCINYWEAGNWALNDEAEPKGRKRARDHRSVHMHLLGRSRSAATWGESPQFPPFAERKAWAAHNAPLTPEECRAVVERAAAILEQRYGVD